MNLYKIGQAIKFLNEDGVKTRILKMKDAEYSAYLSVLSQIHADVLTGVEVEDAAENAAGAAYAKSVLSLIEDIGKTIFKSTMFNRISQALDEIRESGKPAAAPTPIVNLQEPQSQFLTPEQVLNLNSEERIEYLTSLVYPDNVAVKAHHILENVKLIESAYSDPDVPEVSRDYYQKELASAIITLLELASGEEEEEPETEEVAPTKIKRPKPVGVGAGPAPKTPTENVSNASSSSTLSPDKIAETEIFNSPSFKDFLAKSKNPYIDFSVSPPVFNNDMELVFGNFIRKVEEIFKKTMIEGATLALKQGLNDAVYTIKIADSMAFEELQKFKEIAPKELEGQLNNFEHRLVNECPSALILKSEFLDNFFYTTILLSAPKLGKLLLMDETKSLEKEMLKYPIIQEDDFDDFKNGMEEFSRTQFLSKASDYFQLTSHYKEKNFLDRAGMRWEFVFKRTMETIFPEGPQYLLKPCPTCFKMVPWSYSKEAKKINPTYQGFRVRLVSFFTDDRDHPKITQEDLLARKWPAPPSALFSQDREKQLMLKYAKEGEKSWEEIQALLHSNDPVKHEEGWHRRTGALYAAGGVFLNTTDLLIKNLISECPANSDKKAESRCGISFAPTRASRYLSGATSLQPQWNGVKDKGNLEKEFVSTLVEDLWEDKDLYQLAKQKQQAGFKFSKINFACTCRISQIESLTSFKHNNIAISKAGVAGSRDFVYPTKPNGMLDTDLEDGTLTYMVCGAPTSLSSFDRNPDSVGFILKYLQAVRNRSVQDYQNVINYFILSGLEVQDVMDLDQDLDRYIAEGIDKQSNPTQDRMQKIAELMKQASNMLLNKDGVGSEERKYFGGLTLVCPFGHRFTVEHSLQFGESNAGIYQGSNIVKDYADLINSQGTQNLKSLVLNKYLVPADHPDMGEFKKLPYEEWIKDPNGVVFPDYKNPEFPLLTFSIPINLSGDVADYVFYKRGHGWKDNVWDSDRSYEYRSYAYRAVPGTVGRQKALAGDDVPGSGDEQRGNLFDLAAHETWNLDNYNQIGNQEFNQIPTSSIPGTPDLEDDTGVSLEAFDQKIAAFSRMLKSALRIIITWTKGLVSQAMMSAMLTDYKINIAPYRREIMGPTLQHIKMENLDGEPPQKGDAEKIAEDAANFFVERINKKANGLYDWIRANIHSFPEDENFDTQAATSIIYNAMKEFNSTNPDIGFYSEYGEAYFEMDNFDNLAKNLAKKIAENNPNMVRELVLKSQGYFESVEKKVQYNGRILLVGYAQYLAEVLVQIYKKYCADPDSNFYIGYDIGIDLSSVSRILGNISEDGQWIGGISEEDVNNITSSLEEILDRSGPPKKISPQSLHYGYRIDRAWGELRNFLSQARKQSISDRAMERSKDYIVARMSFISGQDIERIQNKISNSFPNRSLLFNGTAESPETGVRLVSKRRLPFNAKKVSFLKIPGTQKVEEWLVREKATGKNQVFGSKVDADNYLQSQIAAGAAPDTFIVEPDPYWVNEEKGYDGSAVQVGMICPKVTQDFEWPPTPGNMDFVGINLPFVSPGVPTETMLSNAKILPIPSYRFVIDFEGEPLDISFLFRKGRSDDDFNKLMASELFVINAHRDSKRNIEVFRQEHSEEILNNPKALADFTALEEARLADLIEPHMKVIDAMSIYLTTKSSYVDPAKPDEPRKMLRVALEDPLRAYRLINNPEARGISLSLEEQKKLIKFVIKVYNLDLIAELVASAGGVFADFKAIDLLEKAHAMKFKAIAGKLKSPTVMGTDGKEKLGWLNDVGQYYSLIPGEKNRDYGSYMQYVYNTSQNVIKTVSGHPDISILINSTYNAKQLGLFESDNDNNVFAEKMERDMVSYIESRTSGQRKNDAKDSKKRRKKKNASDIYSLKIALRQSELERIILSMGLGHFDDVEIPDF